MALRDFDIRVSKTTWRRKQGRETKGSPPLVRFKDIVFSSRPKPPWSPTCQCVGSLINLLYDTSRMRRTGRGALEALAWKDTTPPPSGMRWRERGGSEWEGVKREALRAGGWMADNYLVHKTPIWRYFVIAGARYHTPSHTITQWIYSKWLFHWSWPSQRII